MTEENKGAAVELPERDGMLGEVVLDYEAEGSRDFGPAKRIQWVREFAPPAGTKLYDAGHVADLRARLAAEIQENLAHHRLHDRHGERVIALEAEVVRLRQGLWDCFAAAGGDTDGDATPRAVVSDLVKLAVECVRETRQQDAEGLGALRAQRDEAVAVLAEYIAATDNSARPAGDDDFAAMLRFAEADKNARATLASLKEQAA